MPEMQQIPYSKGKCATCAFCIACIFITSTITKMTRRLLNVRSACPLIDRGHESHPIWNQISSKNCPNASSPSGQIPRFAAEPK